jgi:hypothetical protein
MNNNAQVADDLTVGSKNASEMVRRHTAGRHRKSLGSAGNGAKSRNRRMTSTGVARPSSWPVFLDQFERFTDVLCCAAQFGVSESLEHDYIALRDWFGEHYYEHADRVRPHLHYAGSDDPLHSQLSGPTAMATDRQMDRFEAMFLPRSLGELLSHDNGQLISHISFISSAVYAVEG